ncbi:MAG: tail fiber protein [Tannerella sp.]|jgi:microcystin-dependent protein|nr:tail fiber protein [Tannerella sp.]
MDSINFLGQPDYPLSCQDADMIQGMAMLAGTLSLLGGEKYILAGCAESEGVVSNGTVVISGVPYRFAGGAKKAKVTIREIKTDRMEFGKDYPEAWTKRDVVFSDTGEYPWSDFERVATNRELKAMFASIRGDAPGTVKMWAGQVSKIPAGYMLCDGDELSISDYPELFEITGVAFGGDGISSFRLPDLRGRFVAGYDNADADYNSIGRRGGEKEVTLTKDQLPEHDHTDRDETVFDKLSARAGDVDATNTPGSVDSTAPDSEYRIAGMTTGQWTEATIKKVGKNEAHENRPPYFTLAYIIKVTV